MMMKLILFALCMIVVFTIIDAQFMGRRRRSRRRRRSFGIKPPQNCKGWCARSYYPICGSDGKTYNNECLFNIAVCKSKGGLRKKHNGHCIGCNRVCTQPMYNYYPICGSDGRTYYNKCSFKIAECRSKGALRKRHDGKCCDKACTRQYSPICGTDGKTYSNKCVFDIAVCKSNGRLTKKRDGKCTRKVCRDDCSFASDPVCGTDGKTYSNNCILKIQTCKTGGKVVLKHKGECKEDKPVCSDVCPFISDPVCGTNGKTYSNECVLKIQTCETGGKVVLKHEGECKEPCLVNSCKTNQCKQDEKCVADIENCTFKCKLKCPCDYTGDCSCDDK